MNCAPTIPATRPSARQNPARRLAVVLSHPVQYYSPWFQTLAESQEIELRVFYLWNPESTKSVDRGFGVEVNWDIPLLQGYDSEFVPNQASDPGTHHFGGLHNPDLASRIANWNPDAVLFFGYAWQSHLRAILSPALWDVPFFFRGDSHDLCPTSGFRPFLSHQLRRFLFRRFDAFLSVGQAHRDYLEKAGVPSEKIFRAPHCIDNRRFAGARNPAKDEASAWKRDLGIAGDRTVVLFVGKFEDKKRPLNLLDAFLALDRSHFPGSPALLFVGNGKHENELREKAGSELGKNIFFAPFQNQTEMPKAYATGDLLVLPSYGRGETWGLVVNESMNLETPALVSSHVGCGSDLIVEGKTGWRFRAGDRNDLQRQLAHAIGDPDRLDSVGKAAGKHIKNFSYDAATMGLLEAFSSLRNS